MENIFYLSQKLGLLLKSGRLKLAVAESCTGGGLAHEITAVAGSSEWFDCGFITYSNESKIQLLGVKPAILEKYGAVSEEVAKEMALGALARSQADIAISITGIAGPSGGTPDKPVGLVCFGLARKNKSCETRHAFFTSGRGYIRREATVFSLRWLLENS